MPWPPADLAEPPADPLLWRLVVDRDGHPGAVNMARDEALLDGVVAGGQPALRLYRWHPPTLSLGRNEPAARRYDRRRIEALGIDVVRRPSGGRAVWHEQELTYAVAAPIAAFGSLRTSYAAIHGRLAEALQALGAPAALAPERALGPLRASPCFGSHAGGEVLCAGRKVVGSAQLRRGRALLQHGSILLAGTQALVYELAGEQPGAETNLTTALGRAVTFDEVAHAVSVAFGCDLGTACPGATPPPALTATFRDPAWTWRR
jgi:lipoyl(octanoyl) transferase